MVQQKNCPVNEKTVNKDGKIDQIIDNMGMSATCKRKAHSAVKTVRTGASAESCGSFSAQFKDNPLGMVLVAGIALVVVGGGLKMTGGKAAKGKKIMIFLFMMLLGAGLFSLAQFGSDFLSKVSFLSKVKDGIKLAGIAIFTIGLVGLLWTFRPKKETKDEMVSSAKSSVSLGGSGSVFGKCGVSSPRFPSSTRQPRTQNAVSAFTPFEDVHRVFRPPSVNERRNVAEVARQAAKRARETRQAAESARENLVRVIQQAEDDA
jgi:hypothetical protein